MAETPISGLDLINKAQIDPVNDIIGLVDKSDTAMSLNGSNKKTTIESLVKSVTDTLATNWGDISGDIGDQTDLSLSLAALDAAKLNKAGGTLTGQLTGTVFAVPDSANNTPTIRTTFNTTGFGFEGQYGSAINFIHGGTRYYQATDAGFQVADSVPIRFRVLGSTTRGEIWGTSSSQIDVRADSGLRIRNLTNSAAGALDCGAITASGTVNATNVRCQGGNGIVGTRYLNNSNDTWSAFEFPANQTSLTFSPGVSGLFRLEGTTTSHVALKRSGTTLQVRLGDDSAAGALDCGAITASDAVFAGALTTSGDLVGRQVRLTTDGNGNVINTTIGAGAGTALTLRRGSVGSSSALYLYTLLGYERAQIFATELGLGGTIQAPTVNLVPGTDSLTIRNAARSADGSLNCGAVTTSGVVEVPAGTSAAPGLKIGSTQTGLHQSSTALNFVVNGFTRAWVDSNSVMQLNFLQLNGVGSYIQFNGGAMLYAGLSNTLEQYNGGALTSAQTYRLYNTRPSATNFETLQTQWASNEARIGTAVGSAGGTQRNLVLGHWSSAGVWAKRVTCLADGSNLTLTSDIVTLESLNGSSFVRYGFGAWYSSSNSITLGTSGNRWGTFFGTTLDLNGAIATSSTLTSSQVITSATYTYGQPQIRNSNYGTGSGYQIVGVGSSAIYGNGNAIAAFNDDFTGVRIDGSRSFGFVNGHALANAPDVTIRRNATGPAIETRSAGGLTIRNADGTTTGALSCATITSDGNIQLTEIATPSTPAANRCIIYAKDNGAGKTQLVILMPDGVETVLATQT